MEQNLETFLGKIYEIQGTHSNKPLDRDELKKIALEIGLTESEWTDVLKTFEEHVTRAKGFIRYQNHEDAIKELNQAISIIPSDEDALYNLAFAYFKRWTVKRDIANKNSAEKYANKCIRINPANDNAIRIISTIKAYQPAKRIKRILFIALIAVLPIIIVIYFVLPKSAPHEQSALQRITIPAATDNNTGKNTKEVAIAEILNYYVKCMNRYTGRAISSYNRYLSWVDAETGPTANERKTFGLYKLYEIDDKIENLEIVNKTASVIAGLGTKGKEYKQAYENLEPLVAEADEYYDMKIYKDDNYSKAKEMHAPLLYAFKKYIKADKELRKEVVKQQSFIFDQVLQNAKAEAGMYYMILNMLDLGKKTMNKFYLAEHDTSYLTEVETLVEKYSSLSEDVEFHGKQNNQYKAFSVVSFNRSKEFLKKAREAIRNIRTNNRKYAFGREIWVLKEVLHEYNGIISSTNNDIEFRFPESAKYLFLKHIEEPD